MQILIKHTNLALTVLSLMLSASPVIAKTDTEAQQNYARALAKSHQSDTDHSAHTKPIDKSLEFHGIFYGYLPCNDCAGIKSTLSLKQNNNYLLVTQPAKDSSREYYEKGKYKWDEENHILVLTSRKDSSVRQFLIKDEGTIVQMNSDGTRMSEELEDDYTLQRSDTVKSREVHIH